VNLPFENCSVDRVVVFGSTGLVGKAVCLEAQSAGYHVIGLSRTTCQNCSESIQIDFFDFNHLAEVTSEILARDNLPKAFVFCHRSRISANVCQADALLQSTAVDIYPYLALQAGLINSNRKGAVNIVTVTSNAGFRYAQDVGYSYHITKHAQVAASIGLSLVPSSLDIFSNIVSFGEAIDNSIQDHDLLHRKLFAGLSRCALGKAVPSIDNIAKAVVMLCKASSFGVCGQTLTIDSGLSILTQESLVRLFTN